MRHSLERYLLVRIVAALMLGSAVVAAVVYATLLAQLNESFDDNLHNIASAVAGHHHSGGALAAAPHPAAAASGSILGHDDEADIITVVWTTDGQLSYTSDARVRLPFPSAPGLSRPMIGASEWVLFTSVADDGVVQAAQRVSARHLLAAEAAIKLVPPLLALVLVVGSLLTFALRRGLRPLDAAAADIAARTARTLDPIPLQRVPLEIEPLVNAINGLMARLSEAFAVQRRFLADAAHELRTPITALRLQLSLLKGSEDAAERDEATAQLAAGIARSQHLIEQLLQVARTERDIQPVEHGQVDLGELAREVVTTFSAKAEALDLDLGAVVRDDVRIDGDTESLRVLLNNLVENALRYTPAGGVVDIRVAALDGRPTLTVVDDGPGIGPDERERVFDRFYRGTAAAEGREDGSGLGLSIVRSIADQHRATIELRDATAGRGLDVRLTFPVPAHCNEMARHDAAGKP
ncbi:MAG: ATP-binding protein [Burkholderiaceae bacterium]